MRKQGFGFEKIAIEYLESLNLVVVKTNFHSRFGEIDIIAIDKNSDLLHFIEVKSGKFDTPINNYTETKHLKILQTIDYFFSLKKHEKYLNFNYSVDLLLIETTNSNLKYNFLENITI
jgi:putative endonuclease